VKDEPNGTMTEADLTEKSITPIGNFSHYVKVTQDWIMLKGGLLGCRKRLITLHKSLLPQEKFGYVHISTGDILRANVKEGTKLGKKASEYMTAGKLVLSELIVNLVKDRLAQPDIAERGCLLDGFPRAPDQAKAMVDAGIEVDKFVLIEVPDDTLVERGCGRRLDPETGDIYHLKSKPELAEYAKLGLPIRGAERVVFTLELKSYEKANVEKFQINGGIVEQKVNFTMNFFEQEAKVSNIFAQHKTINVIGATKAKGLTGVGAHWGYTSLSRLAHRGLRIVACIGAWRPARVQFHLPRSGPNGFHLQRRAMRVILSESSEV
jgi:adenylate kinase family enzyme